MQDKSMIHHTKAVRRGIKRSFLIRDLPFMSYQVSTEEVIMEEELKKTIIRISLSK